MKTRKIGRLIAWSLFLFTLLLLSGCGQKSGTASDSVVVETVTGGVEKSSLAGNEETEGKAAKSSAHKAEVTKETAPEFLQVDETVYVTGEQVRLRAEPDGEVLGRLNRGDELRRTGVSDHWSRVEYEGKEAYISSQFVSKERPEVETPAKAAVSGTGAGKIIAIDAGHQAKGNSEKEPIGPGASKSKAKVASGATGVTTKVPEYQLTLAVSKKLKAELEGRGYRTFMIRETDDVNISNAERAQMANGSGADIFIRVHANSLDDQSVHGTLTMCQTANNPYNGQLYAKSSSLSKQVAAKISEATGFRNRGVQETDVMSGINWCSIPVTIVEMGFMSNPEEDRKMQTEEYQDKIAKGIADGVDAYYAAGN